MNKSPKSEEFDFKKINKNINFKKIKVKRIWTTKKVFPKKELAGNVVQIEEQK